jgi:hypothetical protein
MIKLPWLSVGFFIVYIVGVSTTLSGLSQLEEDLSKYTSQHISVPYLRTFLPIIFVINIIVIVCSLETKIYIQTLLFIIVDVIVFMLLFIGMIGMAGYILFTILETVCSSVVDEFNNSVIDIVHDYISSDFNTSKATEFCNNIDVLSESSKQVLIGGIIMVCSEIHLLTICASDWKRCILSQ